MYNVDRTTSRDRTIVLRLTERGCMIITGEEKLSRIMDFVDYISKDIENYPRKVQEGQTGA